jgi:predicted phage gp36 major capsid-like protein
MYQTSPLQPAQTGPIGSRVKPLTVRVLLVKPKKKLADLAYAASARFPYNSRYIFNSPIKGSARTGSS